MDYVARATPGQFKPVKLYVNLNDPISIDCIRMVRANTDLERLVEVVDAYSIPVQSRPQWLKGCPSLINEKNEIYIGPEAIMWIRYQSSQSLAGINESTGTAQIIPGAPAAIDGAANLTGSLGMTSFVPQEITSDNNLLQNIGGNRAAQRFEQFVQGRSQMPVIAPPQNGMARLPDQ